jgi:hypothetical protein
VIDFSKVEAGPAVLKRIANACREYAHDRPDHNHGLCHWLHHYLDLFEARIAVQVFMHAAWAGPLYEGGYVTPDPGFNTTRLKLALKLAYAIDEYLTRPEGAA